MAADVAPGATSPGIANRARVETKLPRPFSRADLLRGAADLAHLLSGELGVGTEVTRT